MKAIMVVGTTSHAGKSFLTTALCRILARRGWHVTPFKGQNMALNSYVTPTGGEMGFAQAVQAWAAGTAPRVEMNPILLKPQGNMTSQVILMGKVAGQTTASDYYEQYFKPGWEAIASALKRLAFEYDLVICEGAGSPAEINLKHRDLTNMRVAQHLGATTLLVVDIDRGGAFAHVVGTLALLDPEERALIKGIIINKFRGQRSLLDSGIKWLEDYTGIPVLGVIPWSEILFPAEDSLDLFERKTKPNGEININVIRLPRISNFTDFDALESEPTVSLNYLDLSQELGYPDAVIIPGSKTTIQDLSALHTSGMAEKLEQYANAGGIVLGICGGFQMLGRRVLDPNQIEGKQEEFAGLNLLPIETTILPDKITTQRQVFSNHPQSGLPVTGYEIHQGITRLADGVKNLENVGCQALFNDEKLGIVTHSQLVWGCYLHGLFDNGAWRRAWLNFLRHRRGLSALPTGIPNYREQREATLNSVADLVEANVNLSPILSQL
ncbi:cobyric acid synthase CobQ [Gloeothece citriformis PCC 7424]|uniref:Cobyric acid synthase n=1 Tax=Gloeothece citriformis (strain PCC 7424) TaxID=65393 RepID=COBQ_GLOC7|nr:cobyric acid synthase CobQ [Gloeothece citriformis]B7KHS7.1 RecName: Full=Cobyric acid synthase [Gloeothece citriformis PCC 7424]ACK72024.1 cobyric acid synthase CobQ [Gloeothece citriformis PCC 7424]